VSGIYREKVSEFRKRYFTGKRPCANSIKKWFPVERIGNDYFVLVDSRGEPVKLDTGNKDANDMLKKWHKH
jgi:hypothetical protein